MNFIIIIKMANGMGSFALLALFHDPGTSESEYKLPL